MCIDYSQIINLYTELDTYSLPRIDKMINDLAKYKVFFSFDHKSAYHQVPLKVSDRKYTAFKVNGDLFQFCRIPFGVKNGAAAFQTAIKENLCGAFPYIEYITIAGCTQSEMIKLKKILRGYRKGRYYAQQIEVYNFSLVNILGYHISGGIIKPDPERFHPLKELSPPENSKSAKRALSMFAHYAKWIHNFSDKI